MRQDQAFRRHYSLRRALGIGALVRILLGAALPLSGAALPAVAHAAARIYAIPAGPLEEVLGRFGRESDILLSFKPEITTGLSSPGLQGSYTVDRALALLLKDSGIEVTRQPNGSYLLIKRSADQAETLPDVTVAAPEDIYAGGQIASSGNLGILGNLAVMDTPFSTMTYTAELLANQQVRTLADVVINEASVRTLTSTNGFGEDFQIRGYTVASGDAGLNGLYGLTPSSHMPSAIMERVEVLKGPDTLLNGMSPNGSVGGGINIITKRAGDEPLTRLSSNFVSAGQIGEQVDVSRRFGEDKAWGIRINGAYMNGATGIKDGTQQQAIGALELDYKSRALRWSLDAYSMFEDNANIRPQIGFTSDVSTIPAAPSADSNWFPGTRLKYADSVLASRLEYDLAQDIMLYGAAGYRYGNFQQTLPYGSVDSTGNGSVGNAYYDAYSKTSTADVGVRMRLHGLGIGHTLVLGMTQLNQETGYAYVSSSYTSDFSIYNQSALPTISTSRSAPARESNTRLTSLTLADTLSIADGKLLIIGGVRRQSTITESYSVSTGLQTAAMSANVISPLLALVIKPLDKVSLYANYTSGLTPGGVVSGTQYVNVGQVLAPYKATQYESGVKVDWGHMSTSMSLFQIQRAAAMATQIDASTQSYGYNGQQRNRGLELSAYGEAMPKLRLMASATFYDARLIHTEGGTYDGNHATGVPHRTVNLGADWDTPWLPEFSLNARMLYTSSEYYNASNTLSIPSWTRIDVGARYRTRIGGKAVVLRANVENLFNRNYWLDSATYVTVAAGRTILLSAQVDF
jgi:iron complex outermembrane receptor protein